MPTPTRRPRLVGGDFNIAPADRDVYDPAKFVGATHVSEPERDRLGALERGGSSTCSARCTTATASYSWWDYRAGDFHQGRGLRIDLLMCSPSVADEATWSIIDRNARKGKSPSDHAPVIVDLDLTDGSAQISAVVLRGSQHRGELFDDASAVIGPNEVTSASSAAVVGRWRAIAGEVAVGAQLGREHVELAGRTARASR